MNKKNKLSSTLLLTTILFSAANSNAQTIKNLEETKQEPVVNRIVYNPEVHENDPFERFNRAMFSFNMTLDEYILEPVARGYRYVTPKPVRNRVTSSLANLQEPIAVVNHLLQGRPMNSLTSLGRFVVNSTLGLAGMFDVATGWGWHSPKTYFDNTLATWCVPEGPYLVLPFVGSTTPRAATGKFVDNFADPVWWATNDHDDGHYAYFAYVGVRAIVAREGSIELIDDFRRNSVDFYTTVRSAYMQNIQKSRCRVNNEGQAYDFDFDIEE